MELVNFVLLFWVTSFFPSMAEAERYKRSQRTKACELLIVIDEPLYVTYGSKIDVITNLVKDHVNGLNKIYKRSFFKDNFSEYYFRAKNIEVLYDFCEECNHTQKVFLNEFSKYDSSAYCLAVLFTHRDFPQGIQGLAWRNTVCDDRYNTAFITFLNHNVEASKADSVMTLAHEIGHNFGAYHDEDTTCNNKPNNYIMAMSGSSLEHPEFSPCSLNDMQDRMSTILRNQEKSCFVQSPEDPHSVPSFCGNHIVEDGEECDCGLDYHLCRDPCCYPGMITHQDRVNNRTARPCHTHTKLSCLKPWDTALTYGVILPWIIITISVVVLAIVLLLDWRKDKKLFLHVAKPVELIRSENKDQVERREQRNPDVVYSPTRSSQKGLVKEQVAKRNQFETDRKKYPANGFEVKPLNVPSVFQSENSKPPPQSTKYPIPKLKATHTGGYTVVPQRPAPPPPDGRHS